MTKRLFSASSSAGAGVELSGQMINCGGGRVASATCVRRVNC